MSDDGTGTVQATGDQLVLIPKGHSYFIFPITGDADDDGARIIDSAIALHHVTDSLDNGELTPVSYDGFGAPVYSHQLEPEDG